VENLLITDRDRQIVREWFEPYKHASLAQLEKAFFKEQQYSYNIARRRMLELKKADYIKVHRDSATNRNIYMYNEDKVKPPSYHRMLVLDVLAEMRYQGWNVEVFEIEKYWHDGKYRSDAFTIFTVNDRRYHMFIEIQTSNNHHHLEKYNDLYKTGAVQQYYGKDFFPKRILLVTDRQYSNIQLDHCQVIQLDTKLNNFATVLL
jgi:hypothetical protein